VVLHPQAQAFLDEHSTMLSVADPSFGCEQIALRRASALAAAAEESRLDVATVTDVDADGVPGRLYRPADDLPVIVHLHGGGWVFGEIGTHDMFSRYLARHTGWSVFTVDYRRAPEHPYPAPLDDCETAVRWLRDHVDELAVRNDPLVVLGDSAGGNLAAGVVCRHPDWFAMQVLVYPCLDPAGSFPSYSTETGGMTGGEMSWYWDAYVPNGDDRLRPEVTPLRREHVADLPAAVVISAEHDPLRDENEAYAALLATAGVPTLAWRQLGMVHGFWRHPEAFDASIGAVGQVTAALTGLR
jgi:acetyl esterase